MIVFAFSFTSDISSIIDNYPFIQKELSSERKSSNNSSSKPFEIICLICKIQLLQFLNFSVRLFDFRFLEENIEVKITLICRSLSMSSEKQKKNCQFPRNGSTNMMLSLLLKTAGACNLEIRQYISILDIHTLHVYMKEVHRY